MTRSDGLKKLEKLHKKLQTRGKKEKNTMNDLDKVYAESVAKDYMPKETNKVRQLKKLDERAKLPAFRVEF